MPTTTCLYGLETAGPTSQREYRRRREYQETDPLGVGPQESAGPSHGPHTPLTRHDRGMATVIARRAAALLP